MNKINEGLNKLVMALRHLSETICSCINRIKCVFLGHKKHTAFSSKTGHFACYCDRCGLSFEAYSGYRPSKVIIDELAFKNKILDNINKPKKRGR